MTYATLRAIPTIAQMISRARDAHYFLEPLSASDPLPPSEIAVTFAGIDFSASICAQAGQLSYERPSVSLTCLRILARWRSARDWLTSANFACASSTDFCTWSGRRTAETITCTLLK